MDQAIKDIFGYCIIPKGTFLYRSHEETVPGDCMFYALKFWVAGAFSNNSTVQVWNTVADLEVVFLVKNLNARADAISSIPDIYKMVYPLESLAFLDDLDIKQFKSERRNRFIRKLSLDYGINGWLSSLESNQELEICIFERNESQNQLSLTGIHHIQSEKFYFDSLKKIRIFPPKDFYDKSQKAFRHSLSKPLLDDEVRQQYQDWYKCKVIECSQNQSERIINSERMNNLRIYLNM